LTRSTKRSESDTPRSCSAATKCRLKIAATDAGVAANNASVTPLIAETTTTGNAARSAETMRATFSMAAASATDVPPNFITIGIRHRLHGSVLSVNSVAQFLSLRRHVFYKLKFRQRLELLNR